MVSPDFSCLRGRRIVVDTDVPTGEVSYHALALSARGDERRAHGRLGALLLACGLCLAVLGCWSGDPVRMVALSVLAIAGAAVGAPATAAEYAHRTAELLRDAPRVLLATRARSVMGILSPVRPVPLPYDGPTWWLCSAPTAAAAVLPAVVMAVGDWGLEGVWVLVYAGELLTIGTGAAMVLDSRNPLAPAPEQEGKTRACAQLESAKPAQLERWARRVRESEVARDRWAGLALLAVALAGVIGAWAAGALGEASALLALSAICTLPVAAASTFIYHSATLRRSITEPLLFVAMRSREHRCAVAGLLAPDGHLAKWGWTSLVALGAGAVECARAASVLEDLPTWLALLGVWAVNFSLPSLFNGFVWGWRRDSDPQIPVEPGGYK